MSNYASGKFAYGYCDRTGFRYPLKDLIEEIEQGRPTGLRVGRDMVDLYHPQDWLGFLILRRLGTPVQTLRRTRAAGFLVGVLLARLGWKWLHATEP